VIALIFFSGQAINAIINWSSIIVNGLLNFIIPLVLFLLAWRKYQQGIIYSFTPDGHIEELHVSTTAEDTINAADETSKPFNALPLSWKSKYQTIVLVLVSTLSILIIGVLILDITLAAMGQNVFG